MHETATSAWLDDTADPWDFYYKVTTLDHAGNESEAAAATIRTGVDDGSPPLVTAPSVRIPTRSTRRRRVKTTDAILRCL